ncbi:hypothetical protein Pelo_10348 [Pelomyxa schiedti]|nr:hypothetical protein Pelo_10348 [Pelomyxa schiedti]
MLINSHSNQVAYLGQVEEETVLTLQALPNDNYQNNRIPGRGDSKTDVWNFGVLVHQLVSPFNPLVEVQITTGRSAGPFHPSSLLPKTARNSNNFPPPSPTKTNSTLIVDIHRLHSAVMAIAESATAAAVAFTTTFESPEVPLWAKQVMECCWTVDPASRPSMACLLNIWCHFDSEK